MRGKGKSTNPLFLLSLFGPCSPRQHVLSCGVQLSRSLLSQLAISCRLPNSGVSITVVGMVAVQRPVRWIRERGASFFDEDSFLGGSASFFVRFIRFDKLRLVVTGFAHKLLPGIYKSIVLSDRIGPEI